ncbi:MAG: cytochrome c peroxidase [Bacteroidota bacterium]
MPRLLPFLFLIVSLVWSCKPDPPTDELPPYEGILDLPDEPYSYSATAWPSYFFVDSVMATDNTPPDNPISDWGATLGRVLFYDVILSKNNTLSCASCHDQQFGFSDPRQFSVGYEGGLTGRNSMGLANSRFYASQAFFWDERAGTLEDQVLMPIQDHVEMGLTLEEMQSRLRASEYYPYLFEKAFGSEEISSERAARAMAQFVRSMVSYETRYDQGRVQVTDHREPFPNFTEEENEGKDVFYNAERGNCGACHLPDVFSAKEVFNIGLDLPYLDAGLGEVTGQESDEGKFKSPSLKNIAITAPYMHDGRFATLEEVVEFYNEGVWEHPNLGDPMRFWLPDGPPRPLFLSEDETQALVTFMETLTDSVMMTHAKWSDPFL